MLRDLSNTIFRTENFIERALHPGLPTKLVTFKDAIQLTMVLPGEVAKETRSQFAGILQRYMAGDGSLRAEIEANAGSAAPIAQLARESLGMQAEADPVVIGMKRKREELELFKMEEEIKGMVQARIFATTAELERLRDPVRSNLDDRTRLMIQDSLQNTLLGSLGQGVGLPAITNSNAPISIASVAAKLGYKPTSGDSKRIGMDLRKRYVAAHGKPPSKHDQLCDGRVTAVNSYAESDRGLVEAALHAYFRAGSECSDFDRASDSDS